MKNITKEASKKMLFGELEYPLELFVESYLTRDTRNFLLPDLSKEEDESKLLFDSAIHYLKNNNKLYYEIMQGYSYSDYDYNDDYDNHVDLIPTSEIGVYAAESFRKNDVQYYEILFKSYKYVESYKSERYFLMEISFAIDNPFSSEFITVIAEELTDKRLKSLNLKNAYQNNHFRKRKIDLLLNL